MPWKSKLRQISLAIACAASSAMPCTWAVWGQAAKAAAAPSSSRDEAPRSSQSCRWPEVSGERLLDRPLGTVSFVAKTVWEMVEALDARYHVPLSFIETDPEVRLTVELREGTVRKTLDAIVARIPRYRYGFVSSRLVLYPYQSPWDTQRIENLKLKPGPRRRVGIDLVEELRRRVPAIAAMDLSDPWLFGNPDDFVYQDRVEVRGSGSPLELLVQLLGERASAVFSVNKIKGAQGTPLWLNAAGLVRSLELTPSTSKLVRGDQTVQLKLVGTLFDGTRKDLTPAACGTAYGVSDAKVIAVSPEGLVSVRGEGEALVTATNETLAGATFRVTLPGKAKTPSSAAAAH